MAVRFTKLQNALAKGVEDMTPKAAIEEIERWEEQLKDVDVAGAKGLVADLHSLRTKLAADDVDGAAVKKLLADLGGKTARIAERVEDEALATTLKDVGQKLEAAA